MRNDERTEVIDRLPGYEEGRGEDKFAQEESRGLETRKEKGIYCAYSLCCRKRSVHNERNQKKRGRK